MSMQKKDEKGEKSPALILLLLHNSVRIVIK